jgi:hypothetical protein
VSPDQYHVAIKVKPSGKSTSTLIGHFDIFKGFNQKKFFEKGKEDSRQGHFMRDHDEYVATLEVTQRATRIAFSPDHRYCVTFSSQGYELFDLAQDESINADHPEGMRIKKAINFYHIRQNVTYDRLLEIHLRVDNEGDVFKNSWAVFQSKMFSMFHAVKLECVKNYSRSRWLLNAP